jgi:5-methylcytosine-specific restriction endonuclease McrA
MHKMTFEEAVAIRNKYYGETIQVIEEVKQEEYREEVIKTTGKKKRKYNADREMYRKQFKQNRLIVLVLDGQKCRECGSTNRLHVHHIIEKCKGGTNDINNLITLCNDCHKEKHKGENVYNIMNA